MEDQKRVTTIEELKSYAQGQMVDLPPFGEGQPFRARLRRPSLMALVKSGKIPNRLLVTANKLFMEKGVDEKDTEFMPQALDVFEALVEASFVSPTYKELKEAGIELTDDQMMFVFSYTQQGVKALERFRVRTAADERPRNEQKVQNKAKSNYRHRG